MIDFLLEKCIEEVMELIDISEEESHRLYTILHELHRQCQSQFDSAVCIY